MANPKEIILNIEEIVKKLNEIHEDTDRKLCELSEMCTGE